LPEAIIFFKHTLSPTFRIACLAKHSLLWRFLPRHKAAQKNSIHVHKQVSQTWSKPKLKRGVPFKITSGATDSVSQPQVKAQMQVCASQMHSNVTRTCCW